MNIYHLLIWDKKGDFDSYGYFSTHDLARKRVLLILGIKNLKQATPEDYDIEKIKLDQPYIKG